MKFQFTIQDYQLQAVQSVVDTFKGQPMNKSLFEIASFKDSINQSLFYSEKGIGNKCYLDENDLLKNIQKIQKENNIEISSALEKSTYIKKHKDAKIDETKVESYPNLSIEMETGTGKTYTFIRTIYELNKIYGFNKFVIVVHSVPIFEGTVQNFRDTHEHFQSEYNNPEIEFTSYSSRDSNGKKITTLRNFALNNALQVLVINIDSFAKDNNIINLIRENGIKPIEYIQVTNPIVIVDEPQNFETDIRKKAISELNPLCTLRYSATHKNSYNLLYSLNPIQAYDLGLVKQIEVDGISADENYNAAYIKLEGIRKGKGANSAVVKLKINVNTDSGIKSKSVNIKPGMADLYQLSNFNPHYKDLTVTELGTDFGSEKSYIELSSGHKLYEMQEQGGLTDEVLRFQIERTIHAHFAKLKLLKPLGIKVLSLFFIDRVANYRSYDNEGNIVQGKFAKWFEEAYLKISNKYGMQDLINADLNKIHNGYFSSDNSGSGKSKKEIWVDTKGSTNKDDDTYALIMKDKKRLLSLDEPLQFIFSHSALREGWDNPNVFQICTLNESVSELKKRQEIGRGLRLPVNQLGERIFDKKINVLTVIANENYESFVKSLQTEIHDETGIEFESRIKNANARATVSVRNDLSEEELFLFNEMWSRINYKPAYTVKFSSQLLIDGTVELLKDFNQYPKVKSQILNAEKVRLEMTSKGLESVLVGSAISDTLYKQYAINDIYSYIQNKIEITRSSIFSIIKLSERINELEKNPQQFLDILVNAIKQTLRSLLVDGIQYTRLNTKIYEQSLLDEEEIETYLSNIFPGPNDNIKPLEKTLFAATPIDRNGNKNGDSFNCIIIDNSLPERNFAVDCNVMDKDKIRFYFKLPNKFKIPTPAGFYNPDWAVVSEFEDKIFFVAETKSSLDADSKRGIEQLKINYAKKYFDLKEFVDSNVIYKVVTNVNELRPK